MYDSIIDPSQNNRFIYAEHVAGCCSHSTGSIQGRVVCAQISTTEYLLVRWDALRGSMP